MSSQTILEDLYALPGAARLVELAKSYNGDKSYKKFHDWLSTGLYGDEIFRKEHIARYLDDKKKGKLPHEDTAILGVVYQTIQLASPSDRSKVGQDLIALLKEQKDVQDILKKARLADAIHPYYLTNFILHGDASSNGMDRYLVDTIINPKIAIDKIKFELNDIVYEGSVLKYIRKILREAGVSNQCIYEIVNFPEKGKLAMMLDFLQGK